jgi:hypothetical protein
MGVMSQGFVGPRFQAMHKHMTIYTATRLKLSFSKWQWRQWTAAIDDYGAHKSCAWIERGAEDTLAALVTCIDLQRAYIYLLLLTVLC